MTTEPDSSADLVAIYAQRWDEIRHLDNLDRRSIILVVTAITGAVLSQRPAVGVPTSLQVLVGGLALIVCIGSVYATVRNRVTMELALATIDRIETILNLQYAGLFPIAGSYTPPSGTLRFASRTMFSIRGPIVLFFGYGFGFLVWRALTGVTATQAESAPANAAYIAAATAIALLVVAWCFWDNWNRNEEKVKP